MSHIPSRTPGPLRTGTLVLAVLALALFAAPAVSASHRVDRRKLISTHSYGWPIKPFDEPHPIRGGFDDPRIAFHDGRRVADFHFGVDISAPDGTEVYAVEAGTVYFVRPNAVGVRVSRGDAFDYWHIIPVVAKGQAVAKHELLGFIAPGWEHVHFAELSHGYVVNPLRPGALTPTSDHVAPVVDEVGASVGGIPVDPEALTGRVDLVADATDRADLEPLGAWRRSVTTPALVRWRVLGQAEPVTPWVVAADFRTFRLPADAFDSIYARGTRPNAPDDPGEYVFYLAHDVDTSLWPDGPLTLEVSAFDNTGNTTVSRTKIAKAPPRHLVR